MRVLARLPYDSIFTAVYSGLKVNVCLAVAGLPLLFALALGGSPVRAWPFYVAVSALCAPALAAAFASFEALSAGDPRTGRVFWRAYAASFPRSLAIGVAAAAAVIVLGVDFQLALGSRMGAVTPMLVVLIMIVSATAVTLIAADHDRTGGRAGWARVAVASAYLAVRKWYLSLTNLAVFILLAVAVVAKPAVGLFLLPAPALYVIWANTRHIVGVSATARVR